MVSLFLFVFLVGMTDPLLMLILLLLCVSGSGGKDDGEVCKGGAYPVCVRQVGVVTASHTCTGRRASAASFPSCLDPATTGTLSRLADVTPVAKGVSRWASTWTEGEEHGGC